MRRRPRLTVRWRRARWLQVAALVVGALAAIAGGYLVGFVVTRPAPSASPRPSLIAGETPIPTLAPTPTPTATPTATATPTSTPTATATATPTGPPPPPPTPAPTPPLVRSAGVVSVRFVAVALADRTAGDGYTRTVTFVSDRAGEVRVAVGLTTGGSVELCLVAAAPNETPNPNYPQSDSCTDVREGSVRYIARPTRQSWTVTLRALADGTRPVTDLTIRYPGAAGAVKFLNFGFNGMEDRKYNGPQVEFPTSARGQLRATAAWQDTDSDSTHDWALTVSDAATGSRVYRTAGTGSDIDVRSSVPGARVLALRLENRDFSAVNSLVSGSLSWP